jgi:hypothetical protein
MNCELRKSKFCRLEEVEDDEGIQGWNDVVGLLASPESPLEFDYGCEDSRKRLY